MRPTLVPGRRARAAVLFVSFAIPFVLGAQSSANRPASLRSKPIGVVAYVSGSLSLVRQGDEGPPLGPGDQVFDGDLLRTTPTSKASLSMDPSSGFSGSIAINPGTTFYLSRAALQGQPSTTLELMSGSLSAKVSKIAGKPRLDVSTGTSIFGVRGTEFEIALSVNDSLLAVCEEGVVTLSVKDAQADIPAGQAYQRQSGAGFVPLATQPADLRDLRAKWIEGEGQIFRAAPLKALAALESRYTDHVQAILDETKALALDPVYRQWLRERRAGAKIDPLDPAVLKQKKDIAPKLISLAKRIAVFERAWWRLQDMVEIVRDGQFSKNEIRKGLAVAAFVKAFDRDRPEIATAIFIYRRALGLYLERSPDSDDFISVLASGGMD